MGGMKACSNGPGHMTMLATMTVYGKKPLKSMFAGTERLMTLKLGMQHQVLEYYQVCSSDTPGLTLICFMARSNLVPYGFVWEKLKQWIF